MPQPRELLDHVENANSGLCVATIVTCEPCARVDVPVGEVVPPTPAVTVRLNVGVLVGTKFATKFTACAGIVKTHVAPCATQGAKSVQLANVYPLEAEAVTEIFAVPAAKMPSPATPPAPTGFTEADTA